MADTPIHLLANIVEHAAESIIAVNEHHQIIVFNKAAEKAFGYSANEALGQPLDLLIPDRVVQAHRKHVQDFSASADRSRPIEHRQALSARRKDSSEFPVEIGLSRLETDEGIILTAVIVDITERKRAEEVVQQMRDRFQALTDNAPDGVALIDKQGRMKFVSPAGRRMFGYGQEDDVEINPAEHTHPDDLPAVVLALTGLIEDPTQSPTLQYRFRHKGGSWRWIESTFTNLLSVKSVEAVVINFRDVTERKQAENRLQEQLERLTALREIDQFITSTFDVRMSMNAVLSRARKLLAVDAAVVWQLEPVRAELEYSAGTGFHTNAISTTSLQLGEGLAGKVALEQRTVQIPSAIDGSEDPFLTSFLKEEAFVFYCGAPLIVKGKVLGVFEVYNRSWIERDPDWLDFFSTLAGQTAIAIDSAQLFENLQRSNLDLEKRVAERTAQLNQTNTELEHANHAKDEFLANMSHELRTPLNSILGMAESLLEQKRDPLSDQQQRSLQTIETSGRHLLDLINDILDLSKIEAGMLDYYPQTFSVEEICRVSLSFVRGQALKKAITLSFRNQAASASIFADSRRLKQILVNLLANAVKFTPEGGKVTLQVEADAEQAVMSFSVSDTGIGIAAEDLRRLFQPFVQLDSALNRQQAGTGLGLALVQRLTDLQGGSIHVESEPGRGSNFTILLPWKRQDTAQPETVPMTVEDTPEQEGSSPEPSKAQATILLAEDNVANFLTIGEYLESHGYEVKVAQDGLEAVQMAQETNPDLILMDIQMPGMDGLEATRRLRSNPRFAATPIIALTALAMPGDRERCLEAGATEYISKPVRLKALLQTISKLLNQAHT